MVKRGRPPKDPFEDYGSVVDPLTEEEKERLHTVVLGLPCVKALSGQARIALVQMIPDAVELYRSLSALTPRYSGKGNKPKPQISALWFRCGEIWQQATGGAVTEWEFSVGGDDVLPCQPVSGATVESPVSQITRCCIEFSTGKPYPYSLRTQGRRARAWFRPTEEDWPEYIG